MDGFYTVILLGKGSDLLERIVQVFLCSPIDGQLVWSVGMQNEQRKMKR